MNAIEIKNLSKKYTIYHQKPFLIREIGKRLIGKGTEKHEFWALKGVNFDVPHGESIGIVGRNGSGKTTLLSLIAGTVYPTTGLVKTNGRVTALLELAAGFHPELTGRENVYLNAALMGFSKREIDEKFHDIVKFSELEDFMDTPIKSYSSGMVVRLGFSVAISVNPDILLLDEVFAVGDQNFQGKCFKAMMKFKEDKKTILFVSHDMKALRDMCNVGILLNQGEISYMGPMDQVIERYS